MKTRIFLLAVHFCFFTVAFSQTKVLFLGNSFTSYYYSVPTLFSGMAAAAGYSVTVDSRTKPGMAVADEQMIGHANDPTTQAKIASQQWDYIVVQDNQGNFASNVGYVPSWCVTANTTLYGQIKANDSCTRIIYFAGWGPVGGTSGSDNTTACINRIHSNSILLNNAVADEIVSPIGKAWITCMAQLPGENLYSSDNQHPSLEGVYLTAATIFTTIFKTDITNVNYSGGVNPSSAQTMCTIAFNTVTDAALFSSTHLNAFTPAVTVNGNTMICPATYTSYQWYENGNPAGTNSNTYTAVTNGMHKVVVTDSMGCSLSSFEVNLTTVGISSNQVPSGSMTVSTISENIFEISSDEPGEVFVYNMQGELICSSQKYSGPAIVDLSNRSRGAYVIGFFNARSGVYKKICLK